MSEDKHVEQIYKKVVAKREQDMIERAKQYPAQPPNELFNTVVGKYLTVLQNPKISQKQQQDAVRDFNGLIHKLTINSDPDVIKVLINEAIEKKYKEKILAQ